MLQITRGNLTKQKGIYVRIKKIGLLGVKNIKSKGALCPINRVIGISKTKKTNSSFYSHICPQTGFTLLHNLSHPLFIKFTYIWGVVYIDLYFSFISSHHLLLFLIYFLLFFGSGWALIFEPTIFWTIFLWAFFFFFLLSDDCVAI